MWIAHILCSGPDCFEELEVVVESLDELNGFVCECGLGYELHAVSDAILTR